MDRRHFIATSSLGVGGIALTAAPMAIQAATQDVPTMPSTRISKTMFLNRNTAAVVLVDHQIGLLTGVRDMSLGDLKHNVVAFAKAARALGVPVVLTATAPEGMWGPTMPELKAVLPDVTVIGRSTVNAWDDARFVKAVEATGRKQLLIGGLSLDVCATLPAMSAIAAGYDARVVLDASGTFSEDKRIAALHRLSHLGIEVTDYATSIVEMLGDNGDPKAAAVYEALDMPFATLVGQIHAVKAR
jgi:nicotinamidase-related amidase